MIAGPVACGEALSAGLQRPTETLQAVGKGAIHSNARVVLEMKLHAARFSAHTRLMSLDL